MGRGGSMCMRPVFAGEHRSIAVLLDPEWISNKHVSAAGAGHGDTCC
jgi:hypothetical protein